jgi:hypothetical protein
MSASAARSAAGEDNAEHAQPGDERATKNVRAPSRWNNRIELPQAVRRETPPATPCPPAKAAPPTRMRPKKKAAVVAVTAATIAVQNTRTSDKPARVRASGEPLPPSRDRLARDGTTGFTRQHAAE